MLAAVCLGVQALDSAGLDWRGDGLAQLDRMKCGVLIGTAMGGMHTFTTAVEDLTTKVSAQPSAHAQQGGTSIPRA